MTTPSSSASVRTLGQEQMDAGIKWEEPPARKRGAAALPWEAWARILRRHPGRWAKLHTWGSPSSAYSARKNAGRTTLPSDRFELRAARDGAGSSLFGRYLGDDEDES